MLKPYVLVFNPDICPRQELLDYLDTLPIVKHWWAFLPSAVFIISDESAHTLASKLVGHVNDSYFLVSQVPPGANNGMLPEKAWEFINSPKSSGRWP